MAERTRDFEESQQEAERASKLLESVGFTKNADGKWADKDGKVPEVYKFVTNKDARETIGRLEKMLKQ